MPTKIGKKGKAASFISKRAAVNRLQVSDALFRRLAVLRGVHPVAPEAAQSRKGKFQKNRLYYSRADIRRLETDRALETYRERRAHDLKRTKARSKGASRATIDAMEEAMPEQRMDLVLKERYPTMASALRDMDDALSMLALVAAHTSGRSAAIAVERVDAAARLLRHFHMLMVARRSIHRVFASVRGYYFETVIAGSSIVWLVPHAFNLGKAKGVNYALIDSFSVLYEALVEFVSFKLFSMVGLPYPPPEAEDAAETLGDADAAALAAVLPNRIAGREREREGEGEGAGRRGRSAKKAPLQLDVGAVIKSVQVDEEAAAAAERDGQGEGERESEGEGEEAGSGDEEEEDETAGPIPPSPGAHVFEGIVVRIGREVPRLPVELVLLSGGATVLPPGASEADRPESHLITDRPAAFLSPSLPADVIVVQPQWVFDSFNFRIRLPPCDYALSLSLPPHLSPFPSANANGYVPSYQRSVEGLVSRLRKERGALGLRNPVLVAVDEDSIWKREREEEAEAAGIEDESEGERVREGKGKKGKGEMVGGETERVVEEGDGDGTLGAPESTLAGETEEGEGERERLAALMLSRRKRRLLTGAKKKVAAREARVASLERKAKVVREKRVRAAKKGRADK
jgi:pescadillo protein